MRCDGLSVVKGTLERLRENPVNVDGGNGHDPSTSICHQHFSDPSNAFIIKRFDS